MHRLVEFPGKSLWEKETGIRLLKDSLGHFNKKTTENHLHLSKNIGKHCKPLDHLFRKEK